MSNSRTYSVARNAAISMACYILTHLFTFVRRTVFIYVLGKEYLGINGLFANILTILSFAELGIGNAIIFSMYKPVAEGNKEKIASLMQLYKKAYRIIGICVLVFGLAISPFLDEMMKTKPDIPENIFLIYVLFLIDSALSYFWTYKKSIIIAHQNNYIIDLYSQCFSMLGTVVQCALLIWIRKYLLFLVIQMLITLVGNITIARKADKLYPYLKGDAKELPKQEKQVIFKNISSLFVYKIASVILNGTDNIIISTMFGVISVGLYSNYLILTQTINGIAGTIMSAFTASVGNLNVGSDKDKKHNIFIKLFLISSWLYGFAAVGFALMANEIIDVWLGKEYLMEMSVVIAVALHLYVNAANFAAYTYRNTLGYFVQGKIAPAVAAVINIVLSVYLGRKFGICGVFFATSIARFLTVGIVDPVLVYKKAFNKTPIWYYLLYFACMILYIFLYFFIKWVVSFITIGEIWGIILKIITITLLFNGIMVFVLHRTMAFQELKQMVSGLIHRR